MMVLLINNACKTTKSGARKEDIERQEPATTKTLT